ncbi:MAG: alpha/beta hydrolase, partial [Bacteroidales bacterium]|nr:alpha/beta hydrolase [Bacteroidales bacterium]
ISKVAPWQYVHSVTSNGKVKKTKETTRIYTFLPTNYSKEDKKVPAVIICPGGSYHHLGMKHEGYQVAQWFAQNGYAAFVLRYRVSSHGYHHPAMIQDLQLTIALIKKFGNEWIDTTKIGAIGFSAGGHLVLHSGIEKQNYIKNEFPASEKYGLRPNYIMAIYPVVSMEDSIVHQKSRKNLLTKKYTESDIHQFSIEQNIPDDMPPTFVLACTDDDVVDVRNSQALWKSLKEKQTYYLYNEIQTGGHGFGMFKTKSEQTKDWNEKLLKPWLDYPQERAKEFQSFFKSYNNLVKPDEQ